MKKPTRRTISIAAFAMAALSAFPAFAQSSPIQPVKIVVPLAPGGITDNLARILARGISQATGQPVIVENRAGAGGNVGSAFVAKSAADGHTLLFSAPGNFAINQFLYPNMPYSPEKDLRMITVVGQVPMVLVVNSKQPFTSLAQLLDYAKGNPGKLSASSGGNGSTSHLSLELFKSLTNVDILHVPYKGAAPALSDLLGGQVQMSINDLGTFLPSIKGGKLRALATGGANRSPLLPGVPSLNESGFKDYTSTGWYALAAPAGTPQAVIDAISRASLKALASPDTKRAIETLGAEIVGGTPEETARFVAAESAKWKHVVEVSGAKVD